MNTFHVGPTYRVRVKHMAALELLYPVFSSMLTPAQFIQLVLDTGLQKIQERCETQLNNLFAQKENKEDDKKKTKKPTRPRKRR